MKIKWNEKIGFPEYIFEEKDYLDVLHLKQMMGGKFSCGKCGTENENHAWEILQNYMKSAREIIIEEIKKGTRSRSTRDLTDLKAAKLDGFDRAGIVPGIIIAQAEIMKIKEDKIKEVENARADADPDDAY